MNILTFMHQSIAPVTSQPTAPALDGKFPGMGTLELSNSPGWGQKKRANGPVLRQLCNILH